MGSQFFEDPRVIITSDGPVVGTTAAEALIVPDYVIPAGELYQGKTYMGHIRGQIGNVVTAVPTITFRVRVGLTSLTGTLCFASAALPCRSTVATTETFEMEFIVVCRSSGSSGTMMGTAKLNLPNITSTTPSYTASATAPLTVLAPATAPATSAVDTTATNILGVTAQWSASNAANVLTVKQYVLMAKN